MARKLSFGDALLALMALTGGIGLLGFATAAWLEGYGWQTAIFSIGSLYTMCWSWARLTSRV